MNDETELLLQCICFHYKELSIIHCLRKLPIFYITQIWFKGDELLEMNLDDECACITKDVSCLSVSSFNILLKRKVGIKRRICGNLYIQIIGYFPDSWFDLKGQQ